MSTHKICFGAKVTDTKTEKKFEFFLYLGLCIYVQAVVLRTCSSFL